MIVSYAGESTRPATGGPYAIAASLLAGLLAVAAAIYFRRGNDRG
jgi:hypothetical protein